MTTSSSPQDTRQFGKSYRLLAGVVLIWAIFFLSGIFSLPLMPPDEPKYAFAAVKMIESGDFTTPSFNCAPRFDKPPLIYWLIAASFKIFGVSDWAARVPSLLATLAVMLLVYSECRKRFDDRTAYLSVIVFATLLHVWAMGRAVAPEMVLVLLETAAILSFARGLEEDNRRRIRLGYVFSALAFLTKGPLGLLIPCGVIFPYFAVKKGLLSALRRLLDPAGIILFLAIGLPWYGLMIRIHGKKYIDDFFLMHNVYRFTGKARQHPFQFYYYFPILLGSLYLWLPFSLHIWHYIKKSIKDRSDGLFLLYWAAFVLVFFTIASNKLHNYILIAYPSLAMLIGSAVRHTAHAGRSVRNISIGFAVIEIAAVAYASFYMKALPVSVLWGGAGVVAATLLLIVNIQHPRRTLPLVVAKGLAMLMTVSLFLAHYEMQISPAFAFLAREAVSKNIPVYFYRDGSEDIIFYANRCINTLQSIEELDAVRQAHDEFILLVREKHMGDLKDIQTEQSVPFRDIRGRERHLLEIKKNSSG